MKTKVTTNKQGVKITKKLEAALAEATECFSEFYLIETSDGGTFFTTTFRSSCNWIMSRVVVEKITKVANKYCNRYEGMIWGFECGEYTSSITGNSYPTPQLYIQLSISK